MVKKKGAWSGSGNLVQTLAGVTDDVSRDITSDTTNDGSPDSIIDAYKTGEAKTKRYADTHIRKTYYYKPEHHRRLIRLKNSTNKSVSAILEDALTVFFDHLDYDRIKPEHHRRLAELSEQMGKSVNVILDEALTAYLAAQK